MSDLAATATRLRKVRQATRDFLALYALDNIQQRVEAQGKGHTVTIAKVEAEHRLADHDDDNDWSLLYGGSALDD